MSYGKNTTTELKFRYSPIMIALVDEGNNNQVIPFDQNTLDTRLVLTDLASEQGYKNIDSAFIDCEIYDVKYKG